MTEFALNNNNNNNTIQSFVLPLNNDEDFVSSFVSENCKAYAVFDGHGGKHISRDLANGRGNFHPLCKLICLNIEKNMENDNSIEDIIKGSFMEMDINMKNHNIGLGGSTATVSIIFQNRLYLAYVGDSSAMIFKNDNCVYQTDNHNYFNLIEKNRLDEKKVEIKNVTTLLTDSKDRLTISPAHYHLFKHFYLQDELAMSRSFGHYGVKAYKKIDGKFVSDSALIVEPTIFSTELVPNMQVIMASDGLWDILENDLSVFRIYKIITDSKKNNLDVSEQICKYAENRCKQEWTVINHPKRTEPFKHTMSNSCEWDDVSCFYLEF